MTRHPLLLRQLHKLGLDESAIPAALLDRVSQSYVQADQERYRLERSITICSEEMSELNANLSEERDRLRVVFESAAVGIIWALRDTTILDCNTAFADMLGRGRNELVGKSFLDFVHHEEHEDAIARAGQPGPGSFERRCVHKDGSIVWVSVSLSSVRDPSGSIFNIAIVSDITEQKHLEISLRHAQKLEAVGRLAAGIAHEINTPIQFVGDNLEFLRSSFQSMATFYARVRALLGDSPSLADLERDLDLPYLEEQLPAAIRESLGGIAHIGEIVQAMKFMSHQGHSAEKTVVDINAALRSVVTVATPETKHIASVILELGEVAPVLGFSTDLNQALLNLVVNAAHSVADVVATSGKQGTIRLRTFTADAHAVIAIEDSGTGIPETVRDRIFDPFFTTKPVGKGSGQGLALARGIIVSKHGGTLTFDTHIGVGTTFFVRIPIHEQCDKRTAA